MEQSIPNSKIVMYGTPTCPMVPPMKQLLNQSNVDYDYINIQQDSTARDRVREINHGNESVPTFVFPDDTTLTEPSAGEMKRKLESIGYHVPITAMLLGNMWNIFLFIGLAFFIARLIGLF